MRFKGATSYDPATYLPFTIPVEYIDIEDEDLTFTKEFSVPYRAFAGGGEVSYTVKVPTDNKTLLAFGLSGTPNQMDEKNDEVIIDTPTDCSEFKYRTNGNDSLNVFRGGKVAEIFSKTLADMGFVAPPTPLPENYALGSQTGNISLKYNRPFMNASNVAAKIIFEGIEITSDLGVVYPYAFFNDFKISLALPSEATGNEEAVFSSDYMDSESMKKIMPNITVGKVFGDLCFINNLQFDIVGESEIFLTQIAEPPIINLNGKCEITNIKRQTFDYAATSYIKRNDGTYLGDVTAHEIHNGQGQNNILIQLLDNIKFVLKKYTIPQYYDVYLIYTDALGVAHSDHYNGSDYYYDYWGDNMGSGLTQQTINMVDNTVNLNTQISMEGVVDVVDLLELKRLPKLIAIDGILVYTTKIERKGNFIKIEGLKYGHD